MYKESKLRKETKSTVDQPMQRIKWLAGRGRKDASLTTPVIRLIYLTTPVNRNYCSLVFLLRGSKSMQTLHCSPWFFPSTALLPTALLDELTSLFLSSSSLEIFKNGGSHANWNGIAWERIRYANGLSGSWPAFLKILVIEYFIEMSFQRCPLLLLPGWWLD